MKPPPKPPDAAESVLQPPNIHIVIDPSRIISIKIKYFIGELRKRGMNIEDISECIDDAEALMEIDARLYGDRDITDLAARF